MFDTLSDKLQGALGDLRSRGVLTEEDLSRAMREIRLALLEADVNFKVVKDFVARVRERASGAAVTKSLSPGQEVVKIVHEELTELMGSGGSKLAFSGRPPTVILLAGLQGAGKTTAAAKLALEIRGIAARTGGGAVCTMGSCVTKPGIVTSVVETATVLLDQRHLDGEKLAGMLAEAKEAGGRFAREEDVEVEWERIWRIDPILFDQALIELADEAVTEVAGRSHRLPSGPLHDAAEVARAGVPTVMLFVQSLRGLSHTKLEDTKPEHLELSVQALDRLATKTIDQMAG